MVNLKNITYDNRDFTDLKYTGTSWFTDGFWNASNVGRTGTLSTARDVDATVTFTFTFPQPANAFYYYGIPQCCGGNYSICVDCYPDAPQFKIIDALNRTDDGHNPPVILFSYTFKNNNDSRFNKSMITVDQFVLQVEDQDAVSSPSSSSSFSVPQTSSLASTSAAAVVNPTPPQTPVGLIITTVAAETPGETERQDPEGPQPFFLASATATTASKYSRSTVLSPSAATSNSSGRRETDAGPVQADHHEDDDDTATLPPEYDQVFRRASRNRLTRTLPSLPPLPQKD
ncbi:hypothetical protein CPB85DRAFT_1565102 [Mucidula mucida]|nr:hypothetical protein CPB85DRAFT_1565102 [Mucidula mucida]